MDFIFEILNNIQPDFIEWVINTLENIIKELSKLSIKKLETSVEKCVEQINPDNFTLHSIGINNIEDIDVSPDIFGNKSKNHKITSPVPDDTDNDFVMDTLNRMEKMAFLLSNDAMSKKERLYYSKKFSKYVQSIHKKKLFGDEDELYVHNCSSSINTLIIITKIKDQLKLQTPII